MFCVHVWLLYVCFVCVIFVPSVLWYCWLGLLTCKNRLPYNLYCVGGDVKHCSIKKKHVCYQRLAFTRHVHITTAAGVSVVVISKLTYAAPAWWGFSTSADRLRFESFLRRAARSGLWESVMTAEELVDDADERLFSKVRYCAYHVLEELLPPKSDSQHNLRKRRHNITLPEKKGHLAAKNFYH